MNLIKNYETVIGLEVHVELKTDTKIFCSCPTTFGAEPNTHCCPVCMGMPGTLPVLNKKVVDYAHAHGVVVEGELGQLAGIEDEVNVSAEDAAYTNPDQVYDFVTRTGVDSLAIAIGTSHGAYKFKPGQKPQLRFDILEEVSKRLPGFPIVLHGASSVIPEFVEEINKYGGDMPNAIGIPEEMLRQAATMAVCKINIDSDLRLAMTAAIRKHLYEYPSHFDPRQYLKPAREAIEGMVEHKINTVLGCGGKA